MMDEPEERIDARVPATEAPRSWWQFSLRTMFILVTLLVIGLTWLVNVRSDSEGSSQRFAPPGERISDH